MLRLPSAAPTATSTRRVRFGSSEGRLVARSSAPRLEGEAPVMELPTITFTASELEGSWLDRSKTSSAKESPAASSQPSSLDTVVDKVVNKVVTKMEPSAASQPSSLDAVVDKVVDKVVRKSESSASIHPISLDTVVASKVKVLSHPRATFKDVMSFGGSAPEVTNSRLAMLGFVAAMAAELNSGESLLRQMDDAPVLVNLTLLAIIAASLAPAFKGKAAQPFGPFTPSAELINGRAAMIGFAALLATEVVTGSSAVDYVNAQGFF